MSLFTDWVEDDNDLTLNDRRHDEQLAREDRLNDHAPASRPPADPDKGYGWQATALTIAFVVLIVCVLGLAGHADMTDPLR